MYHCLALWLCHIDFLHLTGQHQESLFILAKVVHGTYGLGIQMVKGTVLAILMHILVLVCCLLYTDWWSWCLQISPTPSSHGDPESGVNDSNDDEPLYSKYAYHCDICQKDFSNRFNLQGHMACHAEVQEWKCHLCLKLFAYEISLETHLKNIHVA